LSDFIIHSDDPSVYPSAVRVCCISSMLSLLYGLVGYCADCWNPLLCDWQSNSVDCFHHWSCISRRWML